MGWGGRVLQGLAKTGRFSSFHQSSGQLLHFVSSNTTTLPIWPEVSKQLSTTGDWRWSIPSTHNAAPPLLALQHCYLWCCFGLGTNSLLLLGLSYTILYPLETKIHIDICTKEPFLCKSSIFHCVLKILWYGWALSLTWSFWKPWQGLN